MAPNQTDTGKASRVDSGLRNEFVDLSHPLEGAA